MEDKKETLPVRMDDYTRLCLTAITVLLTVLIIALWADHAPAPESASAAKKGLFIDTSPQSQLVSLRKAQEKTSAKIDELIRLFRRGEAKVRIVESGKVKGKGKGGDRAPARTSKRR